MNGYAAKCPSCGAEITFRLGSSLLRVCDHCGVVVARKGAHLESYGKVAELIPTPSVLKLGLEGGYLGAPRFSLVGRLQLSWEDGSWDEWLMGFTDGTWAWLAESQGKFHYMGQTPLPPVPSFDEISVGRTIDLGAPGTFVVAEVRQARFAAAQGELPFDVVPGRALHYADLSGPGGQLGTIDYGTGSAAEALYVGREVGLADLGLAAVAEEDRRAAARGGALQCPQCGGPLEIRAPDQTQRIACPYCGSLLDATRDLKVLEVLSRPPIQPLVPLGSTGTIGGVAWTVIGVMERSVTVEGTRYPWTEYLLYEAGRGFRWLVESSRHWSWVEPVNPGDVDEGGPRYGGETFAHFQSGNAVVDAVLGEFYWTVARGDQAATDDYVKPPHMLSRERVAEEGGRTGELTWSYGTYTPPGEVWSAFSLPGVPPEPEGVGPHQPSPYREAAKASWKTAVWSVLAILVLFLGIEVAGGRPVEEMRVGIPHDAVSGAPESARFLGPFSVETDGNLQVKVSAPVANSWIYLDGALINEDTGEVDDFDVEVSYYFGRDSDGSWSEGGTSATRFIPAVHPGRYTLRLEPQWEAGQAPPTDYTVTVKSRVPRFTYAFLAMLAVVLWPVLLSWKWFRFEVARWSESDHPWVSSSED